MAYRVTWRKLCQKLVDRYFVLYSEFGCQKPPKKKKIPISKVSLLHSKIFNYKHFKLKNRKANTNMPETKNKFEYTTNHFRKDIS